jgi:hypothetical protein
VKKAKKIDKCDPPIESPFRYQIRWLVRPNYGQRFNWRRLRREEYVLDRKVVLQQSFDHGERWHDVPFVNEPGDMV